ncbi:MAG: bifunctional DedA family/phosphatase PAP2 family protein [Pseudomonadota bacterium]|nr:bifunctional DedA family/phosphatase PAP2 family protein [Pseudomonadota bacterium]
MMELLDSLITWVNAHPHWAGLIVFLVAFSESLAIVGVIVPGVVMMFAAGALVGAGAVEFQGVFWWAVAGAVLGDGLSFWIGHHYKEQLCSMWPFSKHPQMLDRGTLFFQRWGGKSVALGRFFGPVRAVIPMVAGMLEMPLQRFLVANILSALGWAFAYLLPGIVIGVSLDLASEVALHLLVLGVVVISGLWLLLWLSKLLFILFQPVAVRFVRWLLDFSSGDTLPRRLAAALADPDHKEAQGLAFMAALLLLMVFSITLIASLLFGFHGFGPIDHAVHEGLMALRAPAADSLMVFITMFGDTWVLIGLSVVVMLLLVRQHPATAWHWLAAVAFAFIVVFLLKHGLRVPRPADVAAAGWSFPSGHTLKSTVIYGFLALLLSTPLKSTGRMIVYACTAVLIALIGFSRLYLGVHWFSDVVAGWSIGLLWVTILGLAWRHHPHPVLRADVVVIAVVIWLLAASGWHLSQRQQQQLALYQPQFDVININKTEWLQGAPLPQWREMLFAGRDPLGLRFSGDISEIEQLLLQQQWNLAKPFRALDLMQNLIPQQSAPELPPIPKLYDGREPALTMTKVIENSYLVLRLWLSHFEVEGCEVWLGHLTEQRERSLVRILRIPDSVGSEFARDQQRGVQKILDSSESCVNHPNAHQANVLRSDDP